MSRELQHKHTMDQFERVCHGTNCNASKAMPHHSAECKAEHDACFAPIAWMRPSEEGYDSAFRDHSTVDQCTGNDWAGWGPLYTKEMMEKAVLAEREVIEAETRKARYEAIGWCHAFCCAALDDGLDPRTIEVPAILEKAQAQLETPNAKSQATDAAEGRPVE